MSVNFQEEAGGKCLLVQLSGKLAKQDYQHFVPAVERLIKQQGKIRLLERFRGCCGVSCRTNS